MSNYGKVLIPDNKECLSTVLPLSLMMKLIILVTHLLLEGASFL